MRRDEAGERKREREKKTKRMDERRREEYERGSREGGPVGIH